MRSIVSAIKTIPHPEPVEGRTVDMPANTESL
jgi:hypothetical protein